MARAVWGLRLCQFRLNILQVSVEAALTLTDINHPIHIPGRHAEMKRLPNIAPQVTLQGTGQSLQDTLFGLLLPVLVTQC